MKKINFKQPKYIFPAIIFLPIVFLGYQISGLVGGSSEEKKGVVTDSINMSLPDADNQEMRDKMSEMDNRFWEDGGYTAIGNLGQEGEEKDSTQSGYSEAEMNAIDAENDRRKQQEKEAEEMRRSLEEARRHINQGGSRGGGSRQSELDDYAKELSYIQRKNKERQEAYERMLGGSSYDEENDQVGGTSSSSNKSKSRQKGKEETKPEIVEKVKDTDAEKFNTVGQKDAVDEPLIKAMIDQTTKAQSGTRLRFKLLDDVVIKKIKIKKGTYLYGTVTGFGQQRVMATITSILVKDKFIKINLSVFDNDGMEGFYVPESAFRSMMKEAGAQAMSGNMNFNNGGMGSELTGESVALQALQNMYQSASTAVSANMRRNKARIKYNTVVYLINTSAEEY